MVTVDLSTVFIVIFNFVIAVMGFVSEDLRFVFSFLSAFGFILIGLILMPFLWLTILFILFGLLLLGNGFFTLYGGLE